MAVLTQCEFQARSREPRYCSPPPIPPTPPPERPRTASPANPKPAKRLQALCVSLFLAQAGCPAWHTPFDEGLRAPPRCHASFLWTSQPVSCHPGAPVEADQVQCLLCLGIFRSELPQACIWLVTLFFPTLPHFLFCDGPEEGTWSTE